MPEPVRSDIVGAILGKRKAVYINRPSNQWILDTQTIGVEVEVEGCPVPVARALDVMPERIRHYWEAHEDHSLHDNGVEFTFREPLFGEDAKEAIDGLFGCLTAFKLSKRAGIHVHLDARDLSRHQLLGLVAYYAAFEPAIYRWIGDNRHGNNFCIPWYKYTGAIDQAGTILRELRNASNGDRDSAETALSACNAFHRYAGLNLKSLYDLGSIEFRHLLTTFDVYRVKEWINLIFSLKKAAMDAPDSTLTILDSIRRKGISSSLSSVFGERVADVMLKDNRDELIAEIVELGLPNATELILSVTDTPRAQVDQGFWEALLMRENEKKKNHPGFDIWRKNNYPKDAKLNPEELSPEPLEILRNIGLQPPEPPAQPVVYYSVYKVFDEINLWTCVPTTTYISDYFSEHRTAQEEALRYDNFIELDDIPEDVDLSLFAVLDGENIAVVRGYWIYDEDLNGDKFKWTVFNSAYPVFPSLEAANRFQTESRDRANRIRHEALDPRVPPGVNTANWVIPNQLNLNRIYATATAGTFAAYDRPPTQG